jgi:hypothetical protein
MSDEQKCEQFITTQKHMVLSVVLDDGTPWAVPVRIQVREGIRDWTRCIVRRSRYVHR